MPVYAFAQLEFTHAIGPAAGRYMLGARRDAGAPPGSRPPAPVSSADVLILSVVEARVARSPLRGRNRARRAVDDREVEVPLVRATAVRATDPLDAERAREVTEVWPGDPERCESLVRFAVTATNAAIRAHRAVTADPYTMEVTRHDARAIRIGVGDGESLAIGGWDDAVELAPEPRAALDHARRIAPSQFVADVLAGRAAVGDGEDLLLRAVLDLELGHWRAGALQLRAAAELLATDLGDPGLLDDELADICAEGLAGGITRARATVLAELAERLGTAVDARRPRSR